MPPTWLKSPHTFFSRSSSLTSVPTLTTPQTSNTHPHLTSSSDEDDEGLRILTPFEREYGKPDLPGGWLDGKALRRRLREVSVARGGEDEVDVDVEPTTPVEEEGQALDGNTGENEVEKDIRVTRLMVHPIKSCRGIPLQKSVVTPQGLEFDRQWAIRGISNGRLLTAREYPEMVLIHCDIDELSNQLRVTFPSRPSASTLPTPTPTVGSGSDAQRSNGNQTQTTLGEQETTKVDLPGFSVDLRVDKETMRTWEKLPSSILHGGSIPPSLFVPACTGFHHSSSTNPAPTPSEQLSTYLRTPVQLIRTSPLKEDRRKCEIPPGVGEGEEWVEGLEKMREVGRGVDDDDEEEGEEEENVVTGFADGYPLLIANEESYRSVSTTILQSTRPTPPPHLSSTFGTTSSTSKSNWSTRSFDHRRFRANVVVGCSSDLPVELRDDLSDETGRGRMGQGERSRKQAEENKLNAWEEDTWRELEFSERDPTSSAVKRKGGLICTSRCGRCQLPNVCPDTAEQDKVVPYKIIAKYRRVDPAQKFIPIFGVNAISTELNRSSEIAVGDRVRVVSKNRWDSLPIATSRDKV